MSITGEQLRAARVRAGLNQADLAKRLGVSVRTVIGWENGQVPHRRQALVQDFLDEHTRPGIDDFTNAELVAELDRRGVLREVLTFPVIRAHDLLAELDRRLDLLGPTRRGETGGSSGLDARDTPR